MSGVRDANVRVGDFVVVVGLGAIGQIAIQLAKKAGASIVIGVDPIAHRCDIARRHGADHCLDPIGTDVGLEIKKLTGKQGADVIIETSGFADALQSALRGLAYGGTISYVAFAKPFAEGFNLGAKRISIMRKLSSLAPAASQILITHAGTVSELKRPAGNC